MGTQSQTSSRFERRKIIDACRKCIKRIDKKRARNKQKWLEESVRKHNQSFFHRLKKHFGRAVDVTEAYFADYPEFSDGCFPTDLWWIRHEYEVQYNTAQELKKFAECSHDQLITVSANDFKKIASFYDHDEDDSHGPWGRNYLN